ncbi:hypothetical protein R3I93_014142 [Phoxinus phoxinus]|uniref:Uncharacterized protein n=1 Tax=Phoxinus phoxinus TaxID=58324 RepID=A0AAN9CTN0_9TELE
MGSTQSQGDYDRSALVIYEDVLRQPCLLPDVGIDASLLNYSGSDSNAVLKAFSNEMLNMVPGYTRTIASVFGPLTLVPNAVGLGALVISMLIEIAIKSSTQNVDTCALLRRVFGEEKASSVRDTMSEYLKRHRVYIDNDQRLQGEIRRLEQQLSNHLTVLRNSLLHDGQMSSRGFKIWVNGAAFHVQMLIHEARLGIKAGKPPSDYDVKAIKGAIDLYLLYLDPLLKEYKTYKINSNMFKYRSVFSIPQHISICHMQNNEIKSCSRDVDSRPSPCAIPEVMISFMDIVYSNYEPIKGLKSYFLNIKNNLNSQIHEKGSFPVPSAAG